MLPLATCDAPVADAFRRSELVSNCYRIRRLLGAGGMGQVFEADDLVLNRRVAIKAHWRHLQHLSIRKEAQALAALRHPSIATVHGVGSHDGIEYVVMERIMGTTLAERLIESKRLGVPVPLHEVQPWLTALADVLATVHAAGIAHRDVKPANIMLTPSGRLVLMDFGIVLPEFESIAPDTLPGTPEYLAPEAIAGTVRIGQAHQLDVYSFGVLAHELLVGELPFRAWPLKDLLLEHLGRRPPTLTRLRPDVPAALDELVAECLSKQPDERPDSMELVAARLRKMQPPTRRSTPLEVLIVEDEPAFSSVLEGIVSDACETAHITVVHDGEAALAHLQRRIPDLLLLDLGLPRVSGVELCMVMRESWRARPPKIVCLSAAARAPDLELLRQLGVRHFIRKDGDLVSRIEQLVETLA